MTTANRPTVAVIVTYNRRDLAQESVASVLGQDLPPDLVIVVDNASDDGTADVLRARFPAVRLIALPRNTGGAGGFAIAVDAALTAGAGLIWMLDDDAVAEPGALRALVAARDHYRGTTVPAGVASRVLWTDGRIHPMNIPRRRLRPSDADRRHADQVGCRPIRTASFCSLLVDADAAREEELPLADYFVWNDDVEYTSRLLRRRVGLLCPESVVVHKTAEYYNSRNASATRFFYDVRNIVWMLTRSRGLRPAERVYYAGATLRRMGRTMRASTAPLRLVPSGMRGLVQGLVHRPRPTADVLRDVWQIAAPGSRRSR